jgi:transcriptional regulator with XRE-family HTH domain
VSYAPVESPAGRPLAERVEWLIAHRWPTDALPPATNAAAAKAITAATGTDLSHTALWKLRTGRADNPTLKTVTALARFFRVPPSYFTDDPDSEAVADQVALLTLLGAAGISGSGLRALLALEPESRRVIAEMIADATRSCPGQPGESRSEPSGG